MTQLNLQNGQDLGPRLRKQVKKKQEIQNALPAEIKSLSLTSYQV